MIRIDVIFYIHCQNAGYIFGIKKQFSFICYSMEVSSAYSLLMFHCHNRVLISYGTAMLVMQASQQQQNISTGFYFHFLLSTMIKLRYAIRYGRIFKSLPIITFDLCLQKFLNELANKQLPPAGSCFRVALLPCYRKSASLMN